MSFHSCTHLYFHIFFILVSFIFSFVYYFITFFLYFIHLFCSALIPLFSYLFHISCKLFFTKLFSSTSSDQVTSNYDFYISQIFFFFICFSLNWFIYISILLLFILIKRKTMTRHFFFLFKFIFHFSEERLFFFQILFPSGQTFLYLISSSCNSFSSFTRLL